MLGFGIFPEVAKRPQIWVFPRTGPPFSMIPTKMDYNMFGCLSAPFLCDPHVRHVWADWFVLGPQMSQGYQAPVSYRCGSPSVVMASMPPASCH